ncbi:Uncharacterised protein [Mycobacteroides abscessus subsp. bolletii]|nr:Uncharacterised protein [Mycobacteroides abscessus subsp. bolletii]SKH07956.1 Uncharacterised protein [Mycobacteroides abscessus subsp. bolletii]
MHKLRQICIADDDVWEDVKAMFAARNVNLAPIPPDEDGTENYCLSPRWIG